jgi:hypothetical protein
VLREYALDFIDVFAPHLERHAVSRALTTNGAVPPWPDAPHWRERQTPHKMAEAE